MKEPMKEPILSLGIHVKDIKYFENITLSQYYNVECICIIVKPINCPNVSSQRDYQIQYTYSIQCGIYNSTKKLTYTVDGSTIVHNALCIQSFYFIMKITDPPDLKYPFIVPKISI